MNKWLGTRYLFIERNIVPPKLCSRGHFRETVMKYFKMLPILLLVFIFHAQSAIADSIYHGPFVPEVGEEVQFRYDHAGTPPATPDYTWRFGDGTEIFGTADSTPRHTYSAPGTYTVTAKDNYTPSSAITTVTVTAAAPKAVKRIDHKPSRPKVGQQVTLTAVNFDSTTCVAWKFGNEEKRHIDTNPPDFVHAFDEPGRHKVRAYDGCDMRSTPVTKYITVGQDSRTTTWSPVQPKAGQRVTFRSRGNYSSCQRVDFGDGTVQTIRTPIFTHTYRRPGIYTVTVFGYCGDDLVPQEYTITVMKGFTIDFLKLTFKDTAPGAGTTVPKRFMGLAPTVDRGTRDFKAKALIKYTGSGVITMQWLVNNRVIQMVTRQVAGFHKRIEIDSVVDLPTYNLGRHDVTVRFISPRGTSLRMPALKYFVIQPKPEETEDVDSDLSVLLDRMINGPRQQTRINADMQLPPGELSLLGGTVFNRGGEAFTGRLNISLGRERVDSQVILELGGGGQKRFEVSLEMGGAPATLELELIDRNGETVATKQYTVEPSP